MHAHLASLACAAVLAALTLTAPTTLAATGIPPGYPAEVTLPAGVIPVYLMGEVYELDEDAGTRRLIARTYELNQEVAKSVGVRRHYERLFSRLSWCGAFRDVAKGTAGWFDRGKVNVTVAITPTAAPDKEQVKITIRVAQQQAALAPDADPKGCPRYAGR